MTRRAKRLARLFDPTTPAVSGSILIRIKLPSHEKNQFERVAKHCGLSAAEMIRVFMRNTIRLGRLPFDPPYSEADRRPGAVSVNQEFEDQVEETFTKLLAADDLVPMASFTACTDWTGQALSEAVSAGRILYLEAKGIQAFPAFYLDARYDRKELEAISMLMSGLSLGSKWEFFTTPNVSLAVAAKPGEDNGRARTPLEALLACEFEAVSRAATGFLHS